MPGAASAQAKRYPLESVEGLRFHNVTAEPAVLQGKKGLRATVSEEILRRIECTQLYAQGLVWIEDLDFSNGVIKAEIAGALASGAGGEARGFVGIAFRVQKDLETYDAFYLRPTNGRADDQERRNHSAQYISLPDWSWSRLRKETPSRDEDQSRGARCTGASLRPRQRTADADCQRRQIGRGRAWRRRAVARTRDRRSLPEPHSGALDEITNYLIAPKRLRSPG